MHRCLLTLVMPEVADRAQSETQDDRMADSGGQDDLNIAKLPSVPRQILKDIPRPPNSASRDD